MTAPAAEPEAKRIRLKSREEGLEPVFNNTSMTDVIFIFLIFFISLSQIKAKHVEVDLPKVSHASEVKIDDGARVVVEVTADGRVILEGTPVESPEALARALRARQQESGKELRVRLRGDSRAAFGDVLGVLAGLAEAGLVKIEFAVQPKAAQ